MARLVAWFKNLIVHDPAMIAWVTGGGLAALSGWVLHFDRTEQAAAAVIITAASAVVTALLAHPPRVSVVTGALATIGAAVGAFGYHPTAHTIATAQLAAGLLLALLYRQSLTSKAHLAEQRAAQVSHRAAKHL